MSSIWCAQSWIGCASQRISGAVRHGVAIFAKHSAVFDKSNIPVFIALLAWRALTFPSRDARLDHDFRHHTPPRPCRREER